MNEKADCLAKCTEQVCASLVEDTLQADIMLLVEDVLEAELQRIHKYINRYETEELRETRGMFRPSCDTKLSNEIQERVQMKANL